MVLYSSTLARPSNNISNTEFVQHRPTSTLNSSTCVVAGCILSANKRIVPDVERVIGVKQLSTVFTRVDIYQRASRVPWHPRCDVVYLVLDYYPAVVGLVVLGHRRKTMRLCLRSCRLQVDFALKAFGSYGAILIFRLDELIDSHVGDGQQHPEFALTSWKDAEEGHRRKSKQNSPTC